MVRILDKPVALVERLNWALERALGPRRQSLTTAYRSWLRSPAIPGGLALHIGAGEDSGRYAEEPQRCEVVALDLDPRSLAHNRAQNKVTGDAHWLPFQSQSFSLVFAEFVFEHLRRPDCVIREVERVLRPGGYFVTLAPNRSHYFALVSRATPHWFHRIVVGLTSAAGREPHPTYYGWGSWKDLRETAVVTGWHLVDVQSVPGPTSYTRRMPLHIGFVILERLLSRWPSMHVNYMVVYQKPTQG